MDRDAVQRARDGDQQAYEALASALGRPLFQVAYRIVRDVDTAEDAVQRALVNMWRDLPRLRDVDRFEAWAYRLVVRTSLEELRQRRRHAHIREVPIVEEPSREGSTSLEVRDALERAFERLSPEHRTVVVLHHYAGFSLGEIADIVGVPYGTVGSRLHYAVRQVRTSLGLDGEQPAVRVRAEESGR